MNTIIAKLTYWLFLIIPPICFLSIFLIKDVQLVFLTLLPTVLILLVSTQNLFVALFIKSNHKRYINKKHFILKRTTYIFIALAFLMKFYVLFTNTKDHITDLAEQAKKQCVLNSHCKKTFQTEDDLIFSKQKNMTFQRFIHDNGLEWDIIFSATQKKFAIYLYYGGGAIHLGACGGLNQETVTFNDEFSWINQCL